MYKKKASLFIVTILLLSMVLTGCNADTLGFISHMEEIQTLTATKATQTVSKVSLNTIKVSDDTLDAEEKALLKTINQHLNNNYITITQKSDTKKNISSISFDLVQNKTNKKESLAVLKYKDEAFALTVGPKLNDIYPGANVVLAPFNNKLIPLSMVQEYFGDSPALLSAMSNPKSLEGIEKKATTFLDELITIYKNADTNVITKEGNAFILQVDTKDFVKMINTFATLTLKNFDPILDKTIKFMDSLTDQEFNAMYATMFPEGRTEVVTMLKEAKKEFATEGMVDEVLLTWNQTYPELSNMISNMFKGSSLRMRTWKENDKYYSNLYSVIQMTDPDNKELVLGTNVLVEEEMKVMAEDFNVTMPTEKISKKALDSMFGSEATY